MLSAKTSTAETPPKNLSLLYNGGSRHPTAIAAKLLLCRGAHLSLPRPLPSPRAVLADGSLLAKRWDGLAVLRQLPQFVRADNATASLYRMSEFLSADEPHALVQETQYFWDGPHALWQLEHVPDPRDSDGERYALLASLVESLVLAFNYRMSLGARRGGGVGGEWQKGADADDGREQQETCPAWTATVPPLEVPLVLRTEEDFTPTACDPFAKRNIKANSRSLFAV